MTDAFLAGVLAGYAIAIPVGAISVLIVELGIRRGFAVGAAAGAGAASADGIYAGLAMVGGSAVADAIAPHEAAFRLVAAAVLVGIALRGFLRLVRRPRDAPSRSDQPRDLMYSEELTTNRLSRRDIATIQLLYQLQPQVVP